MKKYKSLEAGVAELSQCSTRAGATGTASLFGALPPMRPAIGVCSGGPARLAVGRHGTATALHNTAQTV